MSQTQVANSSRGSMSKPLVLVNFKTYESAHSQAALDLAREIESSSKEGVQLVIACSAFDLSTLSCETGLEVWSQHLDPVGMGSFTGWLLPENAIARGAAGTLINHAEHKVDLETVERLLTQLPESFPVCACAADVEEAKALAALSPTFIAVEPPELIGGDISVTTADPSIVSDTVAAVKSVNPDVRVLCGAGVKNGSDVARAIELGAEGVLLASGVTKADNPSAVVEDLLSSL